MPENPTVPPQRKPVSELPTPDQTVSFYTELVGRDDPAYQQNSPMKRGCLYSTIVGANQDVIARFPQLFFLRERKFQLSDQLVLWDWATDEQAHDTYNSTVTYIANNVNYPAYTRVYTVRRELYEQEPTVTVGDPLPGIIAVEIVEAGAGYTYATGRISGDANISVTFTLTPEGGLLNGIITNTGEDTIADGTSIIIEGDGSGGVARSIIQPSSAVLTSQQKEELQDQDPLQHELVKVTRVYETLPGPFIYTTRFDKDGKLVTTGTRRNITADIVDGDTVSGGVWTQTWHKATDSFVSEETVETRDIPGNQVTSTKVDEDGKTITTIRQLVATSAVVSSETIVAGVWIKKYGTEVDDSSLVKVHDASDKVSWQVTESRPVPGNAVPYTRIDDDGKVVSGTRTIKDTTTITSVESLIAGVWTHTSKEKITDLVSYQVTESRPIPGNPVPSSRLDDDGVAVSIVTTLKDTTAIVTSETLALGTWTKTTKKDVSDLVAHEIVESRVVPGNAIPSAEIGRDEEVRTISRLLRDETLITPSATELAGTITEVEKKEVSDLVSNQITTVRQWLDEAGYHVAIPEGIIPEEFRAEIPFVTETHTVAGTASMPTLASGEFEHSKKQQDKLLYIETIVSLVAISLPIIQTSYLMTELNGGGILKIERTLAGGALTAEEGYLVVYSRATPLGNGMWFRETRSLFTDLAWPVLTGTNVDERYGIVIDIAKSVQVAGTTGFASGDLNTIAEVKPYDKWRSIQIVSTLDPSSLPEDVTWYGSQYHGSFPPELSDAVIQFADATCGCLEKFSSVLETNFNQYSGEVKARYTEQFYNGPPPDDVTITQFFPEAHRFGFAFAATCGCNSDTTSRITAISPQYYIPLCLHDDLTLCVGGAACVGAPFTWTFPATNPATLPHGDYIMLKPYIERWRFGVFRRVLTEILVP